MANEKTPNYHWDIPNPYGLQIVEMMKVASTFGAIDSRFKAFEDAYQSHTHSFERITDRPDTLLGYGINDAMTAEQVRSEIKTSQDAQKSLIDQSIQSLSNSTADALALRVRVDAAQTFSLAQKSQARQNIDALGTVDRGVPNGVATLDAGGKIPSSQLPPVAITETFVVNSQASMLALVAERGDVVVRTDLRKSFILRLEPATVVANWQEMLTPTDTVLSVNGETGVVNLTASHLNLGNVANKSEAQMVASGAIADALSETGILAGFRNKIINGDFEIWQRGEGPHTNFGYTADRWAVYRNNGAELASVSRQLFVLGHTEVPGNPAGYFRAYVTNGGPSNSGFVSIGQQIEGVRTLSGKKATLSFHARASSPKEIAIEVNQQFGGGGSPRLNILIGKAQLSTSWQKFSFVIDIPSLAGKTVGSNSYLGLGFILSAGTDFTARFDNLGIQTGTFDFSRVSIVEGDASSEVDPFSPRHIQQEMNLCLRYYQRLTANRFHGTGFGTNGAIIGCSFETRMRVIPSIAKRFTTQTSFHDGVSAITGDFNANNFRMDAAAFSCQATFGGAHTSTSRSLIGFSEEVLFTLDAEL